MKRPTLGAAVAALSLIAPAIAADAPPRDIAMKRDFKPPQFVAAERAVADAFAGLDGDAPRGNFAPFYQWPAVYAGKLRVCFYGGSQEARETIRDLASEWEQPDNSLRFDWGKKGFRDCEKTAEKRLMHIRVAFSEPGYYSMVGTGSILMPDRVAHSMNLEGFGAMTRDEIMTKYDGYLAGTVRHEFGHAIGLNHEHQSPKAECEKDFDWDSIYKQFEGPPNNWDKQTIDFNLRQESDPDIVSTKYDPRSIMKYYYDPKMFKNGDKSSCYTPGENKEISDLDRKTIAFMYPAKPEAAAARSLEMKGSLQAIVDKAEEQGASKGVDTDLVSAIYPDSDADTGDE
jgi:Astacin (Peptidase family M12A)